MCETDLVSAAGWRVGQSLEDFDDFLNFAVVRLQVFFQFLDSGGDLFVCGQHLSQADKRTHDKYAHFDSLFRVEYRRRHNRAMFRESVRQRAPTTAAHF